MQRRRPDGFTAFELLWALLFLGGVSLVLVVVFENLAREVRGAMELSVVAHVRSGLSSYLVDPARGNKLGFPSRLDRAEIGPCAPGNPCFDVIIPQQGVTQGWTKLTQKTYRSPASPSNVWTYWPQTGTFEKTTA